MARILITSGPTRQYLDPVRYLTNASSGKMGAALAASALSFGHEVEIVSGPVTIDYPAEARVHWVETTEEMLDASERIFENCDGCIGVAAPCDYRPVEVSTQKIAKTGQPLTIQLIETADVVATLGQKKRADQWVVGFALETEDRRFRATVKLEQKHCDLMISNGPYAMNSDDNDVEILAKNGSLLARLEGPKHEVAKGIMHEIQARLIDGSGE